MKQLLVRSLIMVFTMLSIIAALPGQATPPQPTPLVTVSPTPKPDIGEIIELYFGDKFRAINQGIQAYPWLTLLALSLILAFILGKFFYGPKGKENREWLGEIWNRLRGIHEPLEVFPGITADALLKPLGPNEEKRFVEVRLFLPPKGEHQEYSPTDITFDSLQQALEADNPAAEPRQPFAKLALLGEPGAGKTWLLRKLAQEAVQRCREDASALIPLLVSLGSHRSGSPDDFLRSQWLRFWPENPYENTFDRVFSEGRLLLLADGLNEISRKQKPSLVPHWRRFLEDNFSPNGNRAIIACRIADFGSTLPIPRLITRPLESKRIQEYLGIRLGLETAKKMWDQIDHDSLHGRGDLLRLAENPFWLDKMAALSETGDMPRSRAQLARKFIDCRLDEEHIKNPEIQLGETGWEPYLEGMSLLAWKGLWRSPNYVYPEAEAKKFLSECRSLPAGSAEGLLQWALSGQILERTEGGIKFHHQLFQEYFAARQLAQCYDPSVKHLSRPRQVWLEYRLWHTPWRRVNYQYSRWDPLNPPPRPDWAEATLLATSLVKCPVGRLLSAVLRMNPILAGECVHKGGVDVSPEIRRAVRQKLELMVQQPPFWIIPLAGGARFLLGAGKSIFPESWRDRLQAWRLMPTSVRLGAARQLGYFDDEPSLAGRRGSLESPENQLISYIEPEWVEIPGGSFRMGSNLWDSRRLRIQRSQAFGDEMPDRIVSLTGYKIGATPVTVAEFDCFMRAEGYRQEVYWPEGPARRWLVGEVDFKDSYAYTVYIRDRAILVRQREWLAGRVNRGEENPVYLKNIDRQLAMPETELETRWWDWEMEKRSSDRHAVKPWLWDQPGYNHPAQPVVGICWYEAQAYVYWINDILHRSGRLSEDWHVMLPSEAQWENAARGVDGRLYPWGNWWSMDRCNSQESRVLAPSPVMMYPHGASPYGVLDMAGNVWEWCGDWYDPKEYERRQGAEVLDPTGPQTGKARVARGGSWNDGRDNARCAYRNWVVPDLFDDDLGFRVVCAPN